MTKPKAPSERGLPARFHAMEVFAVEFVNLGCGFKQALSALVFCEEKS